MNKGIFNFNAILMRKLVYKFCICLTLKTSPNPPSPNLLTGEKLFVAACIAAKSCFRDSAIVTSFSSNNKKMIEQIRL